VTVSPQHLVGREEELEALLGVLEALDQLPAAAVLAGEAGIGKTTLWLAGVEAAEARGYRVLSCRPSEAETGYSFVGLADLIGEIVGEALPELPPLQRRALEAALLLAPQEEARAEERVIAVAFLSTLRTLARGGPLLVGVDDLQWLDGPSLAILRFALPRLRPERVGAMLAVRGDVPPWLRRAFPEERLLALELGGLSVGALHELLRTRIDAVLPRPTLLRICETSGGNPFFALELGRALQRRGGRIDLGQELPLPVNLEELMDERLDGLGAAAREVARVVAVLADPTVGVVEAASGRHARTGVADALAARILEVDGDHLRFTHPLLRSAVSSRAAPAQRRSLHARVARVVATAEERARHLALATPEPSREIASDLDDAARAAHIRGAPAAAAELAEQALRLTPAEDVDDARRRLLFAADRHFEAGDNPRAIALLERARAAAPPGAARAAILVHLAPIQMAVVGPQEAISICREALAESQGDDALEATIHMMLADLGRYTADRDRGLEHADSAVRAASRVGDAKLHCRALATYGLMYFSLGRGAPRKEMEEALALERSLPEWPLGDGATRVVVHQLVWSGDVEAARPIAQEWRDALTARDDPHESGALWFLSLLEWRAGNWELAARYAADSLALRAQTGYEGAQAVAELPAAIIAAHRGQIVDARARAERALALAEATGIRIPQSGHRSVLGFIELSLGNAAAALEYLRPAWQIRDERRLLEPGHRLELADTLEALIMVGELDEAERLLVPWEERAGALDRVWALAITFRCRALLLGARGDLAGALSVFDRALAQHDRCADPFQRGRTLLSFGATQRRAKQRGAARKTLEDALAVFERVGAPLWAAKARAELARIGGRAASRSELTEGERRIAVLVAEGRTNREVAAALFLTEHTVETVLSRAYRKLGIHSRSELSHALAREISKAASSNS
jgi:DNA-binding CsgD family transcriptional regulator